MPATGLGYLTMVGQSTTFPTLLTTLFVPIYFVGFRSSCDTYAGSLLRRELDVFPSPPFRLPPSSG